MSRRFLLQPCIPRVCSEALFALTAFFMIGCATPCAAIDICPEHKAWSKCAQTTALGVSPTKVRAACRDVAAIMHSPASADMLLPMARGAAANNIADVTSAATIQSHDYLLRFQQYNKPGAFQGPAVLPTESFNRNDLLDTAFRSQMASLSNLRNNDFLNLPRFSVEQVNPGSPLPAGDINLPGTGPMVKDENRNCARPAQMDDWKPNERGYIPVLSVPSGFGEVGEIIFVRGGKTGVCGMTLIHPEWALTALHCVASQKNSRAVIDDILGFTGDKPNAVFLLPKLNEAQDKLLDCVSSKPPPSCPAKVLIAKAVFAADLEWVADLPKVDLALVQIDAASTKGAKIVPPAFAKEKIERVTVAGYGVSNVADFTTGFGLLVGWHKGGRETSNGNTYIWNREQDPDGTVQCLGDSGSAVYSGQYFGRSQETRKLFAVMSSITYPDWLDGGLHNLKCLAATTTSSVIVARYKSWICSIAPKISGC